MFTSKVSNIEIFLKEAFFRLFSFFSERKTTWPGSCHVSPHASESAGRAWPRTHWKAEKGRGMNKCKFGGGVGCMEGTNSGFDTKLVRPTTHVDQLFYTTMHYLRIIKNARFEPKTSKPLNRGIFWQRAKFKSFFLQCV